MKRLLVALVLLAMAAGCNTPLDPRTPDYMPTQQQAAAIGAGLAVFQEVGETDWYQFGKGYEQAHHYRVANLEEQDKNPLAASDLDACYDTLNDLIWMNEHTLAFMPPRCVCVVLLDELNHAKTPGDNTQAEHAVYYGQLAPALESAWTRIHGRGFYEVGPEDVAPYDRYLQEGYWWKTDPDQQNDAS